MAKNGLKSEFFFFFSTPGSGSTKPLNPDPIWILNPNKLSVSYFYEMRTGIASFIRFLPRVKCWAWSCLFFFILGCGRSLRFDCSVDGRTSLQSINRPPRDTYIVQPPAIFGSGCLVYVFANERGYYYIQAHFLCFRLYRNGGSGTDSSFQGP
jgi:hypothetical protein